jgi:hypothetical protein
VPSEFAYFAIGLLVVIGIFIFYRIEKEKRFKEKFRRINDTDFNNTGILIIDTSKIYLVEVSVLSKEDKSTLFRIQSTDYDPIKKNISITNPDELIYIDQPEVMSLAFKHFKKYVQIKGYQRIRVKDIPVESEKKDRFIKFWEQLGFLVANARQDAYLELSL